MSLLALVISVVALVISFKGYIWKTKGRLIIDVPKPIHFDLDVGKEFFGVFVEVGDKRIDGIPKVYNKDIDSSICFVEKVGEPATTVKRMKIQRGWLRKRIVDVSGYDLEEKWSPKREGFMLKRKTILGKTLKETPEVFKIATVPVLDTLFLNGLLDLSNLTRAEYRVIIQHTFGKNKSKPFTITLSPSTIEYLQRFKCDKESFIKSRKTST